MQSAPSDYSLIRVSEQHERKQLQERVESVLARFAFKKQHAVERIPPLPLNIELYDLPGTGGIVAQYGTMSVHGERGDAMLTYLGLENQLREQIVEALRTELNAPLTLSC